MQKKIALSIVGFTVFLTIATMFYLVFFAKSAEKTPEPVAINERQNEEGSYKEDRNAFFEMMHAAAPGTNWRKMDEELRLQLAQERALLYNNSGIRGGEWDTLAAGNVVGKWNEVGSFNTAGRMRATEVDFTTNTVYTFSQGGNLWKGDLEGENWAVINDNFNIQSAHFLRKIGDLLIVGTDQWATQSVYRSSDEGLSWENCTGLEVMTNWGYIMEMEMINNASHTIFALVLEFDYVDWGALTSLYRSDDLGESFQLVQSFHENTFGSSSNFSTWAPRYGSDELFLIAGNDLYTMASGTDTLAHISTVPITTNGTRMLSGFQADGTTKIYLATSDWSEGTQFYTSEDGGVSWDTKGSLDFSYFSRNSFNASITNPGQLWFGGVNTYRSNNGGSTWTLINEWWEYYGSEENKLHADIPYIEAFLDTLTDTETLLISTDGGLYTSDNNGITNTNITMEGMRNAQYYDIYSYREYPDIIFAGAQDQGLQRSINNDAGDYYFEQLISGDYGHLVSSDGGENLWMVYPGFAMLAEEAGEAANLYFWDFVGSGYLWLPPIMEDPEDPKVCWWGGGDHLYRLEKGAFSISYEIYDFDFATGSSTAAIAAIAYSPIDFNYWYVLMSDGSFFYSTDRGENWTKTTSFDGPDSHYFYGSSIVASTTTLGTVFIGGSGYSNPAVYKSTNNGVSFSSMNDGLPSTLVYDMTILPGDSLLFAATEVAPYVYVPGEDQWYDLSGMDAPYQTYWAVEYVDTIKTVRFGTYGRGIFEFKLYEEEEPPVSVEQLSNGLVSLFPNPANNNLQFISDMHLANAQINIYDHSGSLIRSYKSITLNRGIAHHIDLNNLPSGMYFAEIKDGNKIITEKFIVQ